MNEDISDSTRIEQELERAREAYDAAREAARGARRDERAREREARHASREAAREVRRIARHAVRGVGADLGDIGKFDIDLGDVGGDEFTDVVERVLDVHGAPRVFVRNVSGETRIRAGAHDKVHVRARKRVRGSSAEKAKRLLENVEVRIEQDGEEIQIAPHLYEQERGWLGLFRGGRVAVDFDITLPADARVVAHTVSGDLALSGTRGGAELQSVSGDVSLEEVHGPLRLKTVSGDASVDRSAGQLDANSVSGDLTLTACRVRGADIVTVSGDVDLDGVLAADDEHRVKTISGDVTLSLAQDGSDVSFKTMSGDLECECAAQIVTEGRRDRRVTIGSGGTPVYVKTVSGDLTLRRSSTHVPPPDEPTAATPATDATQRVDAEPAADEADDVRTVLERLARGELGVEDAAAALDGLRGVR